MPITESQNATISRLNFRLPTDVKEKIARAAVAEGLTVTDFAVHTLANVADQVLDRHHTRKLTDRDRDVFLALLDADDEPNEALRSAFEAHEELISK